MARRAKRRPLRVYKLTSCGNTDTPTSPTDLDPAVAPSHKRRCIQARQKHTSHLQQPSPNSTPTLGDRFHALPTEIRREIFSLFLVRPVKWQLAHSTLPEPCPRAVHDWTVYPDIYSDASNTCIRCLSHHDHTREPLWRHLQHPDPSVPDWHKMSGGKGHQVWTNPWRSQYAPKVANQFLCSECWDLEFRPRPHPAQEDVAKRHLRCLCARRADLDVLMVCRKWYEEAGAVFYARNTFAFESAAVLKGFMTCLPQHWRQKITRVSIMAYHPQDPSGPNEESSGWESTRKLIPIFSLLHTLPRLSYLEADAHFLSRAKIAHRLLKLSLRNVRRVCFVMHNVWPLNRAKHSEWIWPEYHCSRLLVGGFAEEVARAIKGQKARRGLRKFEGVRIAAERQEMREQYVFRAEVGTGNVYSGESKTAYARLWWSEQKDCAGGRAAHFSRLNGLHAYIGTEFTHFSGVRAAAREIRDLSSEEENWRDWTPTSMRDDDFGVRNLSLWRVKAGWDFLFSIQAEEFLDESQKERRGWEFLAAIET